MRLYTVAQTADLLAVSQKTVRALVDRYELEAVDLRQGKGGKRLIRIPETAVDRYIRSSAIAPVINKRAPRREWHLERRRA